MAATKLLANTLKKLLSEPVEGFMVELLDDSNLFEWKIFIEGPSDTCYEGGVFQLLMKFPHDFPMSPPELIFTSDFWHPNVYKESGVVCISILHPPGEDELSGELPGERWLPTQSVTTILLSVISLLSSPNFSSPANVDASVEWRNHYEDYKKKCKRLVEKANREKPAHVVIPHPDTNPVERAKQIQKMKEMNKPMDMDEFMEDINMDLDDDESEDDDEIDDKDEESIPNSEEEKSSAEESGNKEKKDLDSKKTDTSKNDESKTSQQDEKSKTSKGSKSKNSDSKKKKNSKEEVDPQDMELPSGAAKPRRKKKKCIIM